MAVNVNGAGGKPGVSMPLIVVAVVVALALVAFFGYRAFNPPQPRTAQSLKVDDYFSQKAKECNHDFSKLSLADQTKINQMTMGHGAQTIQNAK